MYGYDLFFLPHEEAAIRQGRMLKTITSLQGSHVPPGSILRLWVSGSAARHICNTVCTESGQLSLYFDQAGEIELILFGKFVEKTVDRFASRCGFSDAEDMARFWREQYGARPVSVWIGWLTGWAPPEAEASSDHPQRHPATNIGE
jgi:AraC-like DNA-binding protein